MGKTITERNFLQIKKYIERAKTNKHASELAGVSLETIRRVKNASTFIEYRANNIRKVSVPKPGTVVSPKVKSSNTTTKKSSLWDKFLRFFDIR